MKCITSGDATLSSRMTTATLAMLLFSPKAAGGERDLTIGMEDAAGTDAMAIITNLGHLVPDCWRKPINWSFRGIQRCLSFI
jgi:hypothetical protein